MTLDQDLIRREYAHLNTLFFNSAYFGPSPYRTKQKVSNALFKELDPSFYPFNIWMGLPEKTRSLFASLMGVDVDWVTHQTSCADLMNLIANGITLNRGECVTVVDGEYPSNVLSFLLAEKNGKYPVQSIKLPDYDISTLNAQIPAETKVIALSHVAFDTGRRLPVKEVGDWLKSKGIFFILDTTQSFGGLFLSPQELEVVDVVVSSSYKWLLGPYGHAFGVFKPSAQSFIKTTQASWTKSPNSKNPNELLNYTLETLPGARKYDRGQVSNFLVLAALEGGLELITQLGPKLIEEHNHKLKRYFLSNYPKNRYDLITPEDFNGNIICLKSKGGDDAALEMELKHHNIDVSTRQKKLRLSFHLFNTTDQVDTLIKALDH